VTRLLPLCIALVAMTAVPASAAAVGFLPGEEGFDAQVLDEGGQVAKDAGSHPVALSFELNFKPDGGGAPFPEDDLRDLSLELPPGLIENPRAVPACSDVLFHTPRSSPFEASLSGEDCRDRSQIGIATLRSSRGGGEIRTFGVFNLSPPPGAPSQFGLNPYGSPIVFTPRIRQADGEYGLTLETRNTAQLVGVEGLALTIWGTPWSLLHDAQRGDCLNAPEPSFGWAKCSVGRPAKTPATAYLTLPTFCDAPLRFSAAATSWQQPGEATATAESPPLKGCPGLVFDPRPAARFTDPRASSPSGYTFDINVDTSGVSDPLRRAPTPLRRAVVTLPEGVTINPSVGAGLGVCTPAQYAAETPSSPPGAACPNQSKIGDFIVRSPLIEGPIEGAIFLAAPFDNPFDSLIAIYLVAKSIDRGILVKVAGELRADPSTGRLTGIFDRLPQIPYFQLSMHFREGQRSPLATPGACGAIATAANLTPWRDAGQVKLFSLPTSIAAGVGGGPCPQGLAPFTPQARGGTLNSQAGAYTPFYLHLTRTAVEQEIVSYSAELPPGLLGKIAGIQYCPDAAIAVAATRSGVAERDDPSCPEASRIGRTVAGYGVGSVLSYAPGGLYLAGPYRGSSFSVVAIDSALVGPFDLGVVIVRSAIRVDPRTAQVSIDATGTDPIPHIVQGIPIHLRDVRAYIDRPATTLNPTSCERSTLASALNGAGARFADRSDDTLARATAPFQAFNCGALGFKPRMSLNLKGGTKRGRHPSLRVVVRPRRGDANIAAAQVALPSSLFLDQDNIVEICTKVRFAADNCPAASAYGRARAFTPLLEKPLEGLVYLRSSDNPLPDLVFALEGQGIDIDVAGRIDAVGGGLRGTFDVIPDAPVTKFTLRMKGGKRGLLVLATRNFCSKPRFAKARLRGHNDRGWIFRPQVKAKCGKRKGRK
jgi:hypothetical protein